MVVFQKTQWLQNKLLYDLKCKSNAKEMDEGANLHRRVQGSNQYF